MQKVMGDGLGGDDISHMRFEMVRSCWMAAADPLPVETAEWVVNGRPARLYRPDAPVGAIVYLHGGGWSVGDLESHDAFCRRLAVRSRRQVLALDYPLAPEHPFPAAIHWCVDAWTEAVGRLDVEHIALGGDSAGANLTTCVSRLLALNGGRSPDLQVLVYPGLDPACALPTHEEFPEGFILTAASIRKYLGFYAPDPADPLGCPLHADQLELQPRTLLTVAGFDPLRDEGLLYAKRLRESGVDVELLDEPGLTHGYLQLDGLVQEAGRAIDRIAARLVVPVR